MYRAVKPDRQLDFSPGVVVGKSLLRPAVGSPGTTELIIVEELPALLRYVPRFLVNWMLSFFAPKMIVGQLARYKKYEGLA